VALASFEPCGNFVSPANWTALASPGSAVAAVQTVDLRVAEGTSPAQSQGNPVGDALGEVNGNVVGMMLLQSGGYLSCLEVYDLSDIPHPYGLPELKSLRPFEAGSSPNG